MLITIKVPDRTAVIKYAEAGEFGEILSDVPVTAGMIVAVADEAEYEHERAARAPARWNDLFDRYRGVIKVVGDVSEEK